jgi:hypothetical protein
MTSVNQTSASETNHSVTIAEEEYLRIIWKLRSIQSAVRLLHEKLIDLQQVDHYVLMTSSEVSGFCDVLGDAYEDLYSVIGRLEEKSDDKLQEIGRRLRWYRNHAGFILNFLLPTYPESVPATDICEAEYRCLSEIDLPSVLLLIEEIIDGLNSYVNSLEGFSGGLVTNQSKGTDTGQTVRQASDYDSIMTARIKAIQPEFSALCERYASGDNSELISNPERLGQETKKLRDEIWQLQNQMPSRSGEGIDCRLAVEQLDFVIRLINSKFDFKCSDVVAVSIIVDQALAVFTQSLKWLTPADGGDLVDTVH